MKSRREFLRGAVPVVAGGAALAQGYPRGYFDTTPDDLEFRGWTVKWTGWDRRVDQAVEAGCWYALKPKGTTGFYSTTLGMAGKLEYVNDLVPMSKADGWPIITVISHDSERAAVRQRALDALLKLL